MEENGGPNGYPTNHDRDTSSAGINGGAVGAPQLGSDQQHPGTGGGPITEGSKAGMVNGASNGNGPDGPSQAQPSQPSDAPSSYRMNDLPEEIQHITEGFVPLGLLLSRLAQRTHNGLQDTIMALAEMPTPPPVMNGNSTPLLTYKESKEAQQEREAQENAILAKKKRLIDFIQDEHGRWVKALVITAWSRRAEPVSKLIDLGFVLRVQRHAYEEAQQYLINIKRDLTFSRLPAPDLKTALQTLSTGEAPWMPDLNFIEPPPITAAEQLRWIEELNTLLSLRLNLEDHDKIPYHFRDYTIESGRVTFRVPGEFEVDLTIADEDFEKQFWFIDFRFLFEPAPAELTDALRLYLEARVNDALAGEGLQGCYNALHEFVLTHKITEFVRQANQLARGRWVDTLKVERLNRAMSIQYWCGRWPPNGPKSWIILGVHSGKAADGSVEPNSTSHLSIRWFRDSKEVKDVSIPFDTDTISTEHLLRTAISRHVQYILTGIHDRLQAKPRFVNREAALRLGISETEPSDSYLEMQLGRDEYIKLNILSMNGLFSLTPRRSPNIERLEATMNYGVKSPVDEGPFILERIRSNSTQYEMNRRGKSQGWEVLNQGPVKHEELKPILNTREPFMPLWLKRDGWPKQWYLVLTMSLSGDRWWLIEMDFTTMSILDSSELHLSPALPDYGDEFFTNLTVFTACMITHITDLRTLRKKRIKHVTKPATRSAVQRNSAFPPSFKMPDVWLRLSDMLFPGEPGRVKKVTSWAADFVQIMCRGLQKPSRQSLLNKSVMRTVVDARIKVLDPAKFRRLGGNVERDVAFNPRLGVFALRLHTEVGTSVLETLAHRLKAIERLVECIDVLRRYGQSIKCQSITLTSVEFTYGETPAKKDDGSTKDEEGKTWRVSLDLGSDKTRMKLEQGNPQLRVLDHFNVLLNSNLGFESVPRFLLHTLHLAKSLSAIEDAWQEMEMNDQGHVNIISSGLDWHNLHYSIPGRAKGDWRKLVVRIKLETHRGDPWWDVGRLEVGQDKLPDDEFTAALKSVYNAPQRVWRNLITSASCEPNQGLEALLSAVDEAIRTLATQPPPPLPQKPAAPVPAPGPRPTQQTPVPVPRPVGQQQRPQSQQQMRNPGQNQAAMNRMNAAMNRARPQQPQQGNVVVLDD